jgi:hypothetical protein
MGRGQRPAKLETYLIGTPGAYGVVRLSAEALREYEALCARTDETGMREAATIRRYFERFAAKGPAGLDDSRMMKPLGRFKDGTGKKIQVFEIKAYQWRIYGICRHFNGVPAFIGLCVDPSKKATRGDRSLMERCARLSSGL